MVSTPVLKTFVGCFFVAICGNSFLNAFLKLAFNLVFLPRLGISGDATSGCASAVKTIDRNEVVYAGGEAEVDAGGGV